MNAKHVILFCLLAIRCIVNPVTAASFKMGMMQADVFNKHVAQNRHAGRNIFAASFSAKSLKVLQWLKIQGTFLKRSLGRRTSLAPGSFAGITVRPVLSFRQNGKLVTLTGIRIKIKL